jgi:hypothetical protein
MNAPFSFIGVGQNTWNKCLEPHSDAHIFLLFSLTFHFFLSISMSKISEEPAESPLGLKNTPENPVPIPLEVKGTIPPWLNGVMYRAGKRTGQ